MELVYLFVGEYGILKNKGISLTSRFTVQKKGKRFEIFEGHITRDFFSSRETDVTGFFGINGSGKSTVQELIRHIIASQEEALPYDYIAIFFHKDNFVFCQGQKRIYSVSYRRKLIDKVNLNTLRLNIIPLIYYSSIKPSSNLNQNLFTLEDPSHCVSAGSLFDSIELQTVSEEYSKTAQSFEFIEDIGFESTNKNYAPMLCTVDINFHCPKLINKLQSNITISLTQDQYDALTPDYELKILKKINCINNKNDIADFLKDHSNSYADKIDKTSNELKDIKRELKLIFKKSFITKINKAISQMSNIDKFYFEIISKISQSRFNHGELDVILNAILILQRIANDFDNDIGHEASMLLYSVKNIEDKKRLASFFHGIENNATHNNNNYIIIELRSFKNYSELSELLYPIRNWLPPVEFSWNKISSGQYSQLNMLSQIYRAWQSLYKIDTVQNSRNIVIMIDEGEICLHPEWQRTWLVDTLQRLERMIPENYHIQLLISSHSPLVLSELPTGSVNFLYKTKPEKNNSAGFFAADIYTLYGSGFLLENTLSELAYRKIAQAFKELGDTDKALTTSINEYYSLAELISDKVIKDLMINTLKTRIENAGNHND